ncbi:uncharacterized protein SOCE26_047360 [Sorangium cellulosum]|uniref:Uncharacterized protein n=1 Tax=Sorangium cellulosum TaxID=56 RepID=A0A2L0EVI7_SORCE|nr:uncharacterized protein SOCE26_047360 [Sorangium cellulosum]
MRAPQGAPEAWSPLGAYGTSVGAGSRPPARRRAQPPAGALVVSREGAGWRRRWSCGRPPRPAACSIRRPPRPRGAPPRGPRRCGRRIYSDTLERACRRHRDRRGRSGAHAAPSSPAHRAMWTSMPCQQLPGDSPAAPGCLPAPAGTAPRTCWYGSSDLLARLLGPAGAARRTCWRGSSALLVRLVGPAGTAPRTCWRGSSGLLVRLLGPAGTAPRTCWHDSRSSRRRWPRSRAAGFARRSAGRTPGALAQLPGDTTLLSGSPAPACLAASSAVVLRLPACHPHWR